MNKIVEETIKIAKNRDLNKALALQERLASQIIISGAPSVSVVLGFDASYIEYLDREISISVCTLFEKNGKGFFQKEYFYSVDEVWFPYIFGFLSFREGIGFLRCWEKIPDPYKKDLDLIMVDGNGIFHPRRAGLASHIGLMTGVPTIGCAKEGPAKGIPFPDREFGSYSFLYMDRERVGIILRTKRETKPLWVSPGHLIGVDALRDIVLSFIDRYRISSPIRSAHILSKKLKKEFIS